MSKGLYFHIPFCRSKCPYCDFYSVKYDKTLAESYVDEVIAKISEYEGGFDTVYFGGGTPSILEPELIGKILDESRKQFSIDKNAEITIECNPSKDLAEDFKKYRKYGINRISLGMQSARNEERFALGRAAGQEQVRKACEDAKNAGITNISLDVMLGTPKQTIDTLDETFEFIDKMNVTHISAYMLKIEEGTKFYEMSDRLALPEDDVVSEMYLKTIRCLRELGFEQYEISNFAKKGYESRHNTKYWDLVEYLGIGKSAHSFWNGRRFYYDTDFNKVDDGAGGGIDEKIMLGLRLTKGIDKSLIKKDYSEYVKLGFIKESDTRIALTEKGMLVSNVIINALL